MNIDDLTEGFLRESQGDCIALSAIASAIRWHLGVSDNEQVKARSLDIVRVLLANGLLPGDYDYGNKIYFWDERDPASIIARIDKEWDPAKGDPTLPESICWFSRRHN